MFLDLIVEKTIILFALLENCFCVLNGRYDTSLFHIFILIMMLIILVLERCYKRYEPLFTTTEIFQ